MINAETIRFIKMLDALAEDTLNGFVPLSEYKANGEADRPIIYDDSAEAVVGDGKGHIHHACGVHYYIDGKTEIFHLGKDAQGQYEILVYIYEDEQFVEVAFFKEDVIINVEDGKWFVVDCETDTELITRYGRTKLKGKTNG